MEYFQRSANDGILVHTIDYMYIILKREAIRAGAEHGGPEESALPAAAIGNRLSDESRVAPKHRQP